MLVKEQNTRQVPKNSELLRNSKNYCDILYCYLQVLSEEPSCMDGKHPRVIRKKDINYSRIGAAIGMYRTTVKSRFESLIKLGLVEPNGEDYNLIVLDKELAELVPYSTIRILTSAVNERTISIFIYLITRYRANGMKGFLFTYEQLKDAIGLSSATRSNDYIIRDILTVLRKLGLIEISLVEITNERGNYCSCYQLDTINNKIESVQDSDLNVRFDTKSAQAILLILCTKVSYFLYQMKGCSQSVLLKMCTRIVEKVVIYYNRSYNRSIGRSPRQGAPKMLMEKC